MSRLIEKWEAAFAPELARRQRELAERRRFLAGLVKSAVIGGAAGDKDAGKQHEMEPWRQCICQ